MDHRLEEVDCDGQMGCSRCGATSIESLKKPCPAVSDGAMYQRGVHGLPPDLSPADVLDLMSLPDDDDRMHMQTRN